MAEENAENVENAEGAATEKEVKTEESNVDESGFDPRKFTERPIAKKDEKEGGNGSETATEESEEEVFDWSTYDEDDVDQEKSEDKKEVETENATEENKEVETEENKSTENKTSSFTDEQFKSFADELGINASSVQEFKDKLIELEELNEKLEKELEVAKSSAPISQGTNEVIQKLTDFNSKSDEDLIRLDLKKNGFSDEDIQESIDTYIDNGLLKIEAKKIRNTIEKAIKVEQEKLTQANIQSSAMQKKEHEESVKALTEHISKTETMFGLKIAKDQESLKKVQAEHTKYITSGKYLSEITESSQNIAESAWLWKNRHVFSKALINKGVQQGKEEILKDLGNPEVAGVQRFKGPSSNDGFDPKAFVYGK